MSRSATKAEVQDLHHSLAKQLKTMLASSEHNKSAAFLQVCRQFIRDSNVRMELGGDDLTADELAQEMTQLENAEFPSEFPH